MELTQQDPSSKYLFATPKQEVIGGVTGFGAVAWAFLASGVIIGLGSAVAMLPMW